VYRAAPARRREVVLDALGQTAQAAAVLADATVDEAISAGAALASSPAVQSLDPARVAPELARLVAAYPQYDDLSVVDGSGDLVAETAPTGARRNVADRPFVRRALATGQPAVTDVVVSRRTGAPAAGVVVPIPGPDGRARGVVGVSFDLDRLRGRVAAVGLQPGQVVALLDSTGRLALLTVDYEPSWEQRDFSGTPAIRDALAGHPVRSAAFEDANGTRWALAVAPRSRYGWVAAALWPAEAAFGPVDQALRGQLLAFGAIVVLSLVGAVLLADYLARPVRALTEQAAAVGRGELDRRVDVRTGDELEQLGGAFNGMAGQLAAARAEEERARRLVQAAARATAFLAESGAALAASLEYERTLQAVAHLAIPTLADWCTVDLLDEQGRVRRIAAASAGAGRDELARQLQERYTPQLDWAGHPAARALATGEPTLLATFTRADLDAMARDAGHRELLRALEVASLMAVPLVARGRTLGAITLVSSDPGRRYGPDDLALARDLAARCALAIDNARLYREARRAVRVRDEFLGSASHELRTPLSHIKGFVSTLRQTDVEWDEATRQDFLAEIEREADRLAKLIGDLLDMSRLGSGGLAPGARAPERLDDLVAGGLDRARGALAEHPVAVEVGAELPAVLVDAGQIERVVANLVENAAKYTPPGTPIRLSAAAADGAVELRVEDAGPGIPPDQLERVFETFVRGPAAAQAASGAGLGLTICRRIVEAHGGRIHAENRLEGGARFVVALPATPGAAKEAA
jgi:signal transduction histidine kinase